ncbi:MAG: hypothetical protein L0Z62_46550 [Gemmataceae bacterium]|nr:hypothetical protein [Gemmataceae bacterium]
MSSGFGAICCACIPAASLPVLADLRCEPDIRVTLADERAWVRWEPGNETLLSRLLALPGVTFYRYRDGLWYRHDQSLPSFGLPDDLATQRLDEVLTPAPLRPEPPPLAPFQPKPACLVLDRRPRPTSAVLCHLPELAKWADRATSRSLASIRAARLGERILLLGERLPLLEPSERFWGRRILAPLGYSLEPALPEDALAEAFGLEAAEIVLVRWQDAQIVSRSALQPLTRSGIRLALAEEI